MRYVYKDFEFEGGCGGISFNPGELFEIEFGLNVCFQHGLFGIRIGLLGVRVYFDYMREDITQDNTPVEEN